MDSSHPVPAPRFRPLAWFDAFARRFPFGAFALVIMVSNLGGTVFSFFYNTRLIVDRILNTDQREAFWHEAVPVYNAAAWPACLLTAFVVILPLARCFYRLRRGLPITPEYLDFCRRRLINFPIFQLIINAIGFLPGAIVFPWIITAIQADRASEIWQQFAISFVISGIYTTAQTFFLLQSFLTAYLYPDFFRDTRPESIPHVLRIPFAVRLLMLWIAIVLMPLVALLTVALNIDKLNPEHQLLAYGVVAFTALSGGGIFWLVGYDLSQWVALHTHATAQIAERNFDIRIEQPRPDEWGKLNNHFNDMASALARTWESHETLGQLVSPDVRDHILRDLRGLEVRLQEITVLFVDIRGFTPRCAGQSPERIGRLLNQFLTLVVRSIEEKGGYVNKFLGDGVMALFGATHRQDNHADLAIASAQELLHRLKDLNDDLAHQGHAPLVLGIGIHTGEALVGCFGAELVGDKGQPVMRREFTAIGETVNLCQRIEQLTKKCGGPILISDDTRLRLIGQWTLQCVGPQEMPGAPHPKVMHRVEVTLPSAGP